MRGVTLCVINYNGAAHLPHTLQAVRVQRFRFSEILLVDNASDDESAQLVRETCPCARVIRLERNLGPGAARNAGFAFAANDLILFIDNDVQLDPETAGLLVAELESHPAALAVAPRVLYAADPGTVQFESADCHFLGLMATRRADLPVRGGSGPACATTSLVTACFLMDRTRWREDAPPFDETLGFNLEDHDFAVRACVAGHHLRVQPRASVRHGSGTPGLSFRPGSVPSEEREFYLTRNRWIVVAKCFSTRTLLLLAPAMAVFEMAQLAWFVKRGRARIWSRAAASFWSDRTRLLRERRTIQRTRRARDASVLRDAPLPVAAHARSGRGTAFALAMIDGVLRGYWRLVRRAVR